MSNNELIHEIEESLKQDRLNALWKEYGPYIIGGAILAVVLTGIMSGWRAWNHSVNTRQTAVLVQALSEEDIPAALNKATGPLRPGARAVAWLTEGGVLLGKGKKEEALAVYTKAADDKALPALYGGLARLLSVRLEWSLEKKDADPEALITRLKPLLKDKGSAWHWHALVQAALIAAHDLNDYARAHEYLDAVRSGAGVPPSLLERAKALDLVYALKEENIKKDAVPAPAPAKEAARPSKKDAPQ